MRERISNKCPDVLQNDLILHQDNALSLTPLPMKQFVVEKRIAAMVSLHIILISPLPLFSQTRSVLKETCFESLEGVNKKASQLLKLLSENDL